jgi:hypothetical protein
MVVLATAMLVLLWMSGLVGSGATSHAAAATGAGEVTAQTDDSLPARGVIMIGSAPLEADAANQNETWGIGEVGSQGDPSWAIVRYTAEGGWALGPQPQSSTGQPLLGFEPDRSPLAGQMTADGSGVMLGIAPTGPSETLRQVVLVRNPGGAFQETAPEPVPEIGATALLNPGESLFASRRAPLIAPLEEGSEAGAFVVPLATGASGEEEAVLHWSAGTKQWTREPIEEIPPASKGNGFRVLAIGASSPGNAWLLAQLSSQSQSVALFRRHPTAKGASWLPVKPAPGEAAGSPLTVNGEPFTVPGIGAPPTIKGQVLTVTDEGVWIDGERADGEGSDASVQVTFFFKPAEALDSGEVKASWCNVPEAKEFPKCNYTLPSSLPSELGLSRSIAWDDSSEPYGDRVITGLEEGVSLRLQGSEFKRVLALGGSEPPDDVGASLGAAFSSPVEGWLGNAFMPVHLTQRPAASRLQPYPVPFRRALLAVAPQPEAPVGALGSEALAVGDDGEVARYVPGQGWLPESLLGPGGRHETPRLRAVAWPTSGRAYAVGEEGQMWLWRAETGLWESDPATPLNFRGDLLGIAFDPEDPSRGYAVGQQGVLLRYGKTWTQEPEEALPAEVRGASFTSVAFAGSEAMVSYRVAHVEGGADGESASYTGGLLVNDGAGWQVDTGAAAALNDEIPWAVAGLPDGGAALSATDDAGNAPLVLERNGPESPWQPSSAPYPGFQAPGSLAIFRESGALRVIGAGAVPDTLGIDDELPPPAGFPPKLIKSYPLATGNGRVLRQTAVGWSDEEHEFNEVEEPLGEYKTWDIPYQPDPVAAVLTDPTGEQGWAVGGVLDPEDKGALDTADIARYPAEATPPPGVESAPVQPSPGVATFAFAGDAQCQAPCALRANARLGPDVWLQSALAGVAAIKQGGQPAVRAFFDLGPRLTTGEGHGNFPVDYQEELARYASLLSESQIPAFPVIGSSEYPGKSACTFEDAFTDTFAPFETETRAAYPGGLNPLRRSSEKCPGAAQPGYFSLESGGTGEKVRVIVLEDSVEVGQTQREWLAEELEAAKTAGAPAIVVGSASLEAPRKAGAEWAILVAQILGGDGDSDKGALASAYFYDAPEENIEQQMLVGTEGHTMPSFGSGTLGYGHGFAAEQELNYNGASGYLLGEVDFAKRESGNKVGVTARLIPVVGELALEGKEGVLLRRSQVALFDGLARRPRAGGVSNRGSRTNQSALYIPIPAKCGEDCPKGDLLPEYSFSSSNPTVGNFVKQNLAAEPNGHVPMYEANGKPIQEPGTGGKSDLFCALNAGTTKVTVSAGGLASSLLVTVEAGSARQPCGTVPAEKPASPPSPAAAPPPAPAPAGAAPAASPISSVPIPAPPAIVVAPPPTPRPPASPAPPVTFLPPTVPPPPLLAFVPLPVPTPARPTPPSGTSAVTSPVEAPEREEENEEATESVGNKAVAYRAPEHEPVPVYLLGIVLLAAFAGASIRRPRRGRREVRVAPATISAIRAQRQLSAERRRRH